MPGDTIAHAVGVPLHGGDVRAPADVFNSIFEVFLILGTVVGIVVVTYTMYHAIKYRQSASTDDPYADKVERPQLGEKPTGGTGGRKVFYSFGISAVIVVSLIAWTYTTLLYIENGPDESQAAIDAIEIDVQGFQFGWSFIYPNGHETNTLVVPQDRVIRLRVTSLDVFHNFGIPELRVKTDALPGQNTTAWFTASETGEYTAKCYELCGSGHSLMVTSVQVVPQSEYDEWYENTQSSGNETSGNETSGNETAAIDAGTTRSVGGVPA